MHIKPHSPADIFFAEAEALRGSVPECLNPVAKGLAAVQLFLEASDPPGDYQSAERPGLSGCLQISRRHCHDARALSEKRVPVWKGLRL